MGIVQSSTSLAQDVTIAIIPLTYSQAMLRDDLVIPVNLPTAARRKSNSNLYHDFYVLIFFSLSQRLISASPR